MSFFSNCYIVCCRRQALSLRSSHSSTEEAVKRDIAKRSKGRNSTEPVLASPLDAEEQARLKEKQAKQRALAAERAQARTEEFLRRRDELRVQLLCRPSAILSKSPSLIGESTDDSLDVFASTHLPRLLSLPSAQNVPTTVLSLSLHQTQKPAVLALSTLGFPSRSTSSATTLTLRARASAHSEQNKRGSGGLSFSAVPIPPRPHLTLSSSSGDSNRSSSPPPPDILVHFRTAAQSSVYVQHPVSDFATAPSSHSSTIRYSTTSTKPLPPSAQSNALGGADRRWSGGIRRPVDISPPSFPFPSALGTDNANWARCRTTFTSFL